MSNLEPLPPAGKPAVQSVTIWGASAALLGVLVPPILAHLGIGAADVQEATKDIGDFATLIGSVVAIYGRWRASQPITSAITPKP